MTAKLLTEHHLEVVHLKEGCIGLSDSSLVKMPHCSNSHVMAHFNIYEHDKFQAESSCA